MFNVISVLLSCVVSVPSQNASNIDLRLSPSMVEKPASTKIELPKLLGDTHVVEDPDDLLTKLQTTQQQAWEELQTVKVRAWYCFFNNRGPKPVTWLIDGAYSKKPAQLKELKFNSSKMMEEAKAGRIYEPVGVGPDDKDAWHCLNASIDTPDMKVKAMFTKYMRPDNRQMLTIFPPDSKTSSLLEIETRQLGFAGSPIEFYGKALPSMIHAGGTLVVRQKDDLVELDIQTPQNRRSPRTIYRFDLSKGGCAVLTYNRSRVRATEFQKVAKAWLPLLAKEQSISRYSETHFFDWTINSELAANEFSPKSLPIAEDTVVNDKRVAPASRSFFRDWKD